MKIFSWKLLILGIALLATKSALALPLNNPVPGGILVIDVAQTSDPKPEVRFGENQIFVTRTETHWFAVVGLPKDILPGKYKLMLKNAEGEFEHKKFTINPLPANLRQRTINLPKSLDTLEFQSAEILSIDQSEDEQTDENLDYSKQYQYRQIVSSGNYIPYGWLLDDNNPNELIDHPWVTYITDPESVVRSPSFAVVEQIFLTDHSATIVVLDHENGTKSIISNLQSVVPKLGETLEAGAVIGHSLTVNSLNIGRVDWQVIANQFPVDPIQFIESP